MKEVIDFQGHSFAVVSKVLSNIVEASMKVKDDELFKQQGIP